MTNQQGAPEALRLAESLERRTTIWAEKCFAALELRRLHAENERLAAMVEALQPDPSAAAMSPISRLIAYSAATTLRNLGYQWDEVAELWELSTAPQADSVTAPAGGADGDVDAVALARYKVVPAHESMFHRFAVVAGGGKQQLYLGREAECENMARKFAGAFLDGAFYQSNIAPTPPTSAEGVVV